MTTNKAEDKVHPLVANLVGLKFVPRAAGSSIFRYDRDEMMRLRTIPNSVARPDYLSTDFDGEDGKFSPLKWIEYRWELEGVKNKLPNKKLPDTLKPECEEKPVLSPQRRGFSGGCRTTATEDKKEKDGPHIKDDGWSTVESRTDKERDRDRLGSTGGNSKWRSGVSGGAEKTAKSTDFKLPFQKGAVADKGRAANWKTVEGKEKQSGSFAASGKFLPAKNYRNDDRPEKVPEWADGPTTMDDMIELRGFEESKKRKKVKDREEKENKREPSDKKEKPRTASSMAAKEHADTLPTVLPSTDEEFAALLGLLDSANNEVANFKAEDTKPTGGSRLSRFFKSAASSDEVNNEQNGGSFSRFFPPAQTFHGNRSSDVPSNPVLAMIFANSNGSESPVRSQGSTVAPVRLEDIEKDIPPRVKMGASGLSDTSFKGDPLKDPVQQSHFMDKLSRMARQQEDGHRITPPMEHQHFMGTRPFMNPPPMQPNPHMFPMPLPPVNVPAPGMDAFNAHFHHNLNIQFQSAVQAATASIGTLPPPPIMEAIRRDVFRNVMIHHQAAVQMAMQQHHHQQQLHQQQQPQEAPRGSRAPTMIPSSVQRHMTKVATYHHSEDRKEKEKEDDVGKFENIKKMQMQQQYGALITAMQNGLPLSAWKGSTNTQQSASRPNPAGHHHMNSFLSAAQHQQAQAQLLLMRRQEIMKAELETQNAPSSSSMDERRSSPPYPPGSLIESDFPTELSQVGPIQTPLEKLLAAHGLPASKYESSRQMPIAHRPDVSHVAMSLEELERQLTEKSN